MVNNRQVAQVIAAPRARGVPADSTASEGMSAGAEASGMLRVCGKITVTVPAATAKTGTQSSRAMTAVAGSAKTGMSDGSQAAKSASTMSAMSAGNASTGGAPIAMGPGQAARQAAEGQRRGELDQVSAHARLSNLARFARAQEPRTS